MKRAPVATTVVLLASVAAIATTTPARTARADEAACIAASESAIGLRKQGKLHDALQQLAVCAAASCSVEVREDCARRVAVVDAAMPTLILGAKDAAGNDLSSVEVSMDGVPLKPSLDGRPVSVDPGVHTFLFETAGAPPLEKQLVLREGERDRQETVTLGAPPPIVPTTTFAPGALASSSSTWSTRKTLALVSGGAGVVGLALGAVFGGLAIADKNDETSNCPSTASCPRPAHASEDYKVAGQNATASTVLLIAGGALVAGGAVLWFTAPKPAATSGRLGVAPWLGGRENGLVLTGDL